MHVFRGDDDARRPVDSLPRQVWMIAVVAFVVALGFGVVGPAIPLLAAEFDVGKATAGLAISAFALTRLLSAFGNGKLVDRFAERPVIGVGLALQAVTTVGAGVAPTFALVVSLRALGGVGSAAFTVAAMALLLRIAPSHMRGRAASLYQGGFLLGAVAGPVAGGFLAEISPRVPFLVYGVFLAIAAVVALRLLREPPEETPPLPTQERDKTVLAEHVDEGASLPLVGSGAWEQEAGAGAAGSLRSVLLSRPFVAVVVVNFGVGFMAYGVRNSLFPIYVVEALGKSAAWAGLAFLVGSAAQGLVLLRSGRLVDTRGRRPALWVGGVLATAATAALALPPDTWVFLSAMAVFGVGCALLASAPAAVLADVTRGGGGRPVSVFQMSADLGAVIGPLVTGWVTDAVSYQAAFLLGAFVLLAGLVATSVMPETLRRDAG